MSNNEFTIEMVKAELEKRIKNLNRYNLGFELDNGIITVSCHGVGVAGYEIDVDAGGKTFDKIIDELTPKAINLIRTCKEKSP